MKLKKPLIIIFILFLSATALLVLYISFADLDYKWIQREGFTYDSIKTYLSGEHLVFIDYFTITGVITTYEERKFNVQTDLNTYTIIIDEDTQTAVDVTYEGKGVLPNGGYVGSPYETVLSALRIGSTITVWGKLQDDGVVKVDTLHLLKQ